VVKVTSTDIHLYLSNCFCSDDLVKNGEYLSQILADAVKKSELTVVNTCFKEFENGGGVTVALLLLESHLVIHTWPDRENTVVGDISVCNYSQNNAFKAKKLQQILVDIFSPEKALITPTENPVIIEDIELKHGYDIRTS